MTPTPDRLDALAAVAQRRLQAAAPGSQERAVQALLLALVQLAGEGKESEADIMPTKSSQALAAYEKSHGLASAEARESIARLVEGAGGGFDLVRWGQICRRLATKGLRGRVDLCAADYRRRPGAPRLTTDQRAAYSAIEAQARRGEG